MIPKYRTWVDAEGSRVRELSEHGMGWRHERAARVWQACWGLMLAAAFAQHYAMYGWGEGYAFGKARAKMRGCDL